MTDVIACMPWGQHSVPSKKVACAGCGRPLAVSKPAAKRLGRDLEAMCFPCARNVLESSPQAFAGATLPEIRSELLALGMTEEEIRVRSRLLSTMLLGRSQ